MSQDRATAVATALLAIVDNRPRDVAREEIIALLRDEFADVARQVRDELRAE